VTTESNDSNERILAFILAATSDPELVGAYYEGGEEYLRSHWGFTDDDIAYIKRADVPATLAMTVWPQPPIVWPRPPTVWG
jgi:hypothetical protein